jgi:hypothetical protein
VQSLHQTLESTHDIGKAEEILRHILELFADAEGVSTKLKNRVKPDDANLLVYNMQTDLEPVTAFLHDKMRELSINRQNRTGLRHKAKWALYGEKSLRRLIEDVTDLVNDLIELFPAAHASQRELCEIEVSEIGTDENLPVLKDIAAGQDEYLEAAILKVIENRKVHPPNVTFSGNNNSGFQLGYNAGTMSGFRFGGSRDQ